jgi:outer membrane biosynthesis protein TonB
VALSDEQNAMLRLLASGEQGYDDIAALMGLSVTEVRAKVVGALAQLEAEGKPVPDVPSPVVGGAKPAAAAAPPAPSPPQPESSQPEPPADAPSEPKPVTAEPPPKATAATTPPPSTPPSRGRTITLPSGRGAWLLGGGIAAIVVIVVVILLVSGGGGGNGSSTTSGSTTPSAETGANESAAENAPGSESTTGTKAPTVAKLVAVDGSEAEGQATFGRIKNKLALAVEATGLEPTTNGTSYTVWLAQSPTKMLPLASTAVKASGKGAGDIAAEFEVPVEVLAYLANGTFAELAVTRTEDAKINAAIKVAKKEKTTPAYTGVEVLHGQITGPIVGLAKREKEAKAE